MQETRTAGDTLVTFGKYKGRSFRDVYRDLGYVNWVLKQEDAGPPLKQLRDWIAAERKAVRANVPSPNANRTNATDTTAVAGASHAGPRTPGKRSAREGDETTRPGKQPHRSAVGESNSVRGEGDGQAAGQRQPAGRANPYVQRSINCWKCKQDTPVYSWQGHIWMQTERPPPDPKPPTVQWKFTQTAGISYWANTCEHCNAVQGENFIYKPVGPLPESMRGGGYVDDDGPNCTVQ